MSADKRFRRVAFAEIAVQRLRSTLSGGRKLNRNGELSITIADCFDRTLVVPDSSARVDFDTSEIDTDSEVWKYARRRSPANSSSTDTSLKNSRASAESEAAKDTRAPEQAITLFAFRLTILEKTARGAGALTFVWATVVLLGGFSAFVSRTDFWVVTILLLTEGSRIFLLLNELEWQQARSRSSFSLFEFGSNFAHKSSRVVSGTATLSVTLIAWKPVLHRENSVAIAAIGI